MMTTRSTNRREPRFRLWRCPDCGKRGVDWNRRKNGGDSYLCRYCKWDALTGVGRASEDDQRIEQLAALNPDQYVVRYPA